MSDSVALVQWCFAEEDPAPACDVNVFIASFTTAYGRLEFYELMDKLGPRVFYVDTDSLIFSSKKGDWMPQTGSYLGKLTNELEPNQIKSLLLSHHHSTSALVSEILMSVLQTVQKKQQTIYIWTDSAKKRHWSIYSAPDSAKKQQQFTYGQYIFTDCTEDNVQNTHTYTQYT